MEYKLFPNERVDDLQIKNYRIIQNTTGFCFGTDAVLLANFASVKNGERILDLCTGCGIIPLLLAAKSDAKLITGVEIQSDIAEMAMRSVVLNALEDRVNIICGDIKNVTKLIDKAYDVVTCNPPYMQANVGMKNIQDTVAVSRHEIMCTIDDVSKAISTSIKFGGRFYIIHRAERLADVIVNLRKYKLEPKTVTFVHADKDKEAKLMLISGMLGGGSGVKVTPPIITSNLGVSTAMSNTNYP